MKTDRNTTTALLARLTGAIGKADLRLSLKPVVEELLIHVGLDPIDAEWLTGPSPRFKAPGLNAAAQRAEKLRAALGGRETGVLNALGRFVLLSWETAGDELATSMELAAEELGITLSSMRTRVSLSGGRTQLKRVHPLTGHEDIVTVSRLDEQPLDKRAALVEAEARIAEVRAARTRPVRGAYVLAPTTKARDVLRAGSRRR